MTALGSAEVVRIADGIIHDVGSAFMMDPWTMNRGEALGYADGISFYFAGRGGVLGDVDADVVTAAMGWFHPALVRSMWEAGIGVAGAHKAAQLYFETCANWGRDHLETFDGLDRFGALAERVADAAEPSGLPLFAGWRRQPRADDAAGRAMQLVHVLRELRGGLHLIATTAAALSPVEAIVTNDGPDHALMFGWTDLPDCSTLMDRHAAAQSTTDDLCATVYECALRDSDRREFADLAKSIGAALL